MLARVSRAIGSELTAAMALCQVDVALTGGSEIKSEFFSMFGIPPTECEIEARKDELGVPRLWFRSTGNPLVGLDLTRCYPASAFVD